MDKNKIFKKNYDEIKKICKEIQQICTEFNATQELNAREINSRKKLVPLELQARQRIENNCCQETESVIDDYNEYITDINIDENLNFEEVD